ncbi:MAG: hypothetical protein K6B13_02490 [Prevotella sp.]|nr:hypothetical protein [Prevotella sp.]
MKRLLLVTAALCLIGQGVSAQKEITFIKHEHYDDSNVPEIEEGRFTYDAQGRFLSGESTRTEDGEVTTFRTDYSYESDQKIIGKTVVAVPGYGDMEITVTAPLTNGLLGEWSLTEVFSGMTLASERQVMVYNDQGRLIKTTFYSSEDIDEIDHTELAWEDGNIATATDYENDVKDQVCRYTYDMTRPAPASHISAFLLYSMPAELFGFQFMAGLYPHYGMKPKNLLIKQNYEISGTEVITSTYEFDADGYITRIELFEDGTRTDVYNLVHEAVSAGISNVSADNGGDSAYHTLQGYRVAVPQKSGIYVRNGRKILVK